MFLTVGVLVAAAIFGYACSYRGRDADAQLRAIYQSEWKWRGEQLPEGKDGQRPIADHLPRLDPERALGSRFNIRAFHDTVLELGSVPLPVLAARIDRFIGDGGRGPYPELE